MNSTILKPIATTILLILLIFGNTSFFLLAQQKNLPGIKGQAVSISLLEHTKQANSVDTISLVISNGLDQDITTANMKAFCSIFGLEKEEGGKWIEISNCLSRAPTRLITLKANCDTTVLVPTGYPISELPEGKYRAVFEYSTDAVFSSENRLKTYSEKFNLK